MEETEKKKYKLTEKEKYKLTEKEKYKLYTILEFIKNRKIIKEFVENKKR